MPRPTARIQVRPELPADAAAIGSVHRAAFRREDEARLVDCLRNLHGFNPALSLVATVDRAIVAHILFTPVTIDDGTASTPALALAPVAVLPAWQRQGIGTRIIETGLDACRGGGHRFIVVLGHPRYYPRFGFVQAAPLDISCPFPVPPETFMVLDLAPGLPGDPHGSVVYPQAFSGLE